MALATTNFSVAPEDGWTLVATNPTSCLIKNNSADWEVYLGASQPANTVHGFSLNASDSFSIASITGNIYVRSLDAVGLDNKALFVVISQ